MKVWIDQDLCTGDGLCEEIAPDVFAMLDDGLAYVKDGDKILSEPGGAAGLAPVPAGQEEATIESAEECPGECIYIEIDCPTLSGPGRAAPGPSFGRFRPPKSGTRAGP
ncbi:MAG: ferredoxin [Actinobacteria bacterium]|nr:ferredoxin [Actinomycetota bacterium]